MNKLQLYINKSTVEYKNMLNQNPDEDVRRCIIDVRRSLQFLTTTCRKKTLSTSFDTSMPACLSA